MSRPRGRTLTPAFPPVFVFLNDPVRPQRRFILRADTTGLVHFALDEMSDTSNAAPYCSAKWTTRLVAFDRYARDARLEVPTCLWCLTEPYKLSRRPL